MKNSEIQSVLMNALPLKEVHINSNGSYFQIIVVSEIFTNMSNVKKQQMVYAPLMTYITNNRIHAVSIKTYTPEEWERDCKLINFQNI